MPARRIALIAFDGVVALDLVGPGEVFATATKLVGPEAGYDVVLAAPTPGDVATSSGVRLRVDHSLSDLDAPVDTVLVGGGLGAIDASRDARLVDGVRSISERAGRTGSVCSGAFILAAAGLLCGRRATTHWALCDRLATDYAGVTVEPDRIFVEDDSVWTSAGVSAGVDLALAIVERDLGAQTARDVARWLVVFLQRPGGQSQFSAPLAGPPPQRAAMRELQAWVVANPAGDLSIDALAARTHMSPRHFARVFAKEIGISPGRWVERARVEAACRALEATDVGIDELARTCGFDTASTLHRSFRRVLGVSPGDYRRRFRTTRPDREVAAP